MGRMSGILWFDVGPECPEYWLVGWHTHVSATFWEKYLLIEKPFCVMNQIRWLSRPLPPENQQTVNYWCRSDHSRPYNPLPQPPSPPILLHSLPIALPSSVTGVSSRHQKHSILSTIPHLQRIPLGLGSWRSIQCCQQISPPMLAFAIPS